MNEERRSNLYKIVDTYFAATSVEALDYMVRFTVNHDDGRSEIYEVCARECRLQVGRCLYEKGVKYITVGFTRNHVTVHRSGVSSVIFYDCFYLPPEEREMEIEKQAYDFVCAEFLPIADVYATEHNEYVRHVNSGAFKSAFDKRESRGIGSTERLNSCYNC